MTRSEFFETMPECDMVWFDEWDEVLLRGAYEFKANSKT